MANTQHILISNFLLEIMSAFVSVFCLWNSNTFFLVRVTGKHSFPSGAVVKNPPANARDAG